jgi:ribosomal protein S20
MPITKSAKKSLRSSRAKQAQNEKIRRGLEISLKKVTDKTLSQVVSTIDKAAKQNIIHPNKANRLKARLAKKVGLTTTAKRASSGATQAKSPVKKTATVKKTTTKKAAPKSKK